jgi:phosphoglycerol transferase MdoB-like AlkP superfamily enzyme
LRLLAVPAAMRFALLAAGVNFLVFVAMRFAFAGAFQPLAAGAAAGELLQALYIGVKFDLRLAVLVSVPVALLGLIPFLNPQRRAGARNLWLGYFVAVQALLLFLYAVDLGHYDYARTRVNASIVEHLTPADVALRMFWQTYPVVWGIVGLAIIAALYWLVLHRVTRLRPSAYHPWWTRAAGAALVVLLGSIAIWGKASWYPLRWSDAYFSTNDFVSALALNPVLFLADTLGARGETYRAAKVREHYKLVSDLLEVEPRDEKSLSFSRFVNPNKAEKAPVNLVVIHLESLAGFKVGALGSKAGATPHFDALAAEGLLFTNFFVPAVPTARSVFTMVTGVPDYHGGRSASRDPLIARQHTLVNALAGHERFYFLGGSASWGNIRSLLAQSIERLQVFEEGDFTAERADVWGITDHALLEHAHAALAAAQRPFFAFIQTSGNHRPYTIPEINRRGFELVKRDAESLRAEGFDGLPAYNGLRFMDHAIGHFFKLARSAPYFRNTLFVLYGDHGNPAASDIPFERLGLTGFHVPMLIYAPGFVPPGRSDIIASLVDVLPTSLALMGVPHLNQTLGRDLLVPRARERRFALVPDGLLTDEFLLRSGPGGAKLFRYRSDAPTRELHESLLAETRELQRLREALYETARYMLYHNKPREHAPPAQ